MNFGRAWRVVKMALRPAPEISDLVQILVFVIVLLGGAAILATVTGVVPAAIWVVLLPAGLLFLSAFRLLGTIEDAESRLPLIATREDSDQGYVRLVVQNPNTFSIKGAYVEVQSLKVMESRRPSWGAPSLGYRFPWTSWATGGGSLYMDMPPHAEVPADIAACPRQELLEMDGEPTFFFVHLAQSKERPVRNAFHQTVGAYKLDLHLCAQDLPIGSASVIVYFDDDRLVTMDLIEGENPK